MVITSGGASDDLEQRPVDRGHFSANVSAVDMFEYYLPAFHDCIHVARAMHVMMALNAINGVAASADPELIDGLLRNFSDSWNFTGFVVTDYGGWEGISGDKGAFGNHGCSNPNARRDVCCKDNKCAALRGVQAGLDSDGGGNLALQARRACAHASLVYSYECAYVHIPATPESASSTLLPSRPV